MGAGNVPLCNSDPLSDESILPEVELEHVGDPRWSCRWIMRAPHCDVAAGDEVAFYLHAHEAVGLVHIAFQNDILIVLLTEGGRDLCTLEFGDAVKVPV